MVNSPFKKNERVRLELPNVDIPKHGRAFRAPRVRVGRFDAEWSHIRLPIYATLAYGGTADEFCADIISACEQVREYHQANPPFGFGAYGHEFHPGILHALDGGGSERETENDSYLTVFQYDLRSNKVVAATHYVKLDIYKSLLRANVGGVLGTVITEEISRHASFAMSTVVENVKPLMTQIADGVKNAAALSVRSQIRESMTELQRIAAEQMRLDQQRQRLEERLHRLKLEETKAAHRKLGVTISKSGYVYLLQSPTGYWKIGRTRNPSNRLKTFGVKLPFEVQYRCLIQTDDMYALEGELHLRYRDKRSEGEWFALSDDEVAEICALASESSE